MKLLNKFKIDHIYNFILIINIAVLLLMLGLCFNLSIWADEVSDLRMLERPYSYAIFSLTDAAPPLHFIILKAIVDILAVVAPGLNYIYAAKISSLIPYILLFILSITYVKKNFGKRISCYTGLLCIAMPSLFPFAIEIRQYSWSVFLAFLWFLAFYEYIKKESIPCALLITLLGPLSLLAHYFVAFGIVYSYVFYFAYCLKKKRYKGIYVLLGVSFASVLLFIPYLLLAFERVMKIANGFWLPQVTAADILDAIVFPFKPEISKFGIGICGSVCIIVMMLFVFVRNVKEECDNKRLFALIGMGMPFAVAIAGLFIGRFVFPVFQARYIMPVMACFWLAFSIAIEEGNIKERTKVVLVLFLVVISLLDVYKHTKDEMQYAHNIEIVRGFLDSHKGVIVVDDGRIGKSLPYFTDKDIFYIYGKESKYDEVMNMILNGETVYLFHSDMENVDLSYLETMKSEGVVFTLVETCGMEYVGVEIFELSK